MLHRAIIIVFALFLGATPAIAQLNTGGSWYLTTVGAVSLNSASPYAVTKEVAKHKEAFVNYDGKNYQFAMFEGDEYAIFTSKRGKDKAYQILISNDEFTLLCEHYVAKNCDCFEGLHITGPKDEMPSRIRKLLPFSLKVNLVDEINIYRESKLEEDDFEEVCDIIEYLSIP